MKIVRHEDRSPAICLPDGVDSTLRRLIPAIQSVLGEEFVGMYLYGSLATGGFHPQKSDIDFLVVTEDRITDDLVDSLRVMHEHIAAEDERWGSGLEGSYIPRASLRRYNPGDVFHPHIDRGDMLKVERHDTDWVIQRYVLREYGVTLVGPPVKDLIDPISPGALRSGVLDMLWWWELQTQDTSRIEKSGYQAYAVLTMCRVLYTLEHGDVLSKPEAARWALENLEQRWASLIERALSLEPGVDMDRLDETVAFLRYALARSGPFPGREDAL